MNRRFQYFSYISLSARYVTLLAVIHVCMLFYGIWILGPGWDEFGHLPAGLSHWRTANFDLYRVNPPLVRLVATLPLCFHEIDIQWMWNPSSEGPREEFRLGKELWSAHGMEAYTMLRIARCMSVIWSVLAIVVLYRWGKQLFGPWAGLFAVMLWCVSPSVLANAQMITPDTGATAVGLTASYSFWRWLSKENHNLMDTLMLGGMLGLAELTKFTWVILYVLWPLVLAVTLLHQWRQQGWAAMKKRSFRRCFHLMLISIPFSVLVINWGYGFENSFRPLGQYKFVSDLMRGDTGDVFAAPPGNRFQHTWLGPIPVPLPANVLQGLDAQRREFETGLPSYLKGQWQHRGWWYYYLYCVWVKVPAGVLALVFFTAVTSLFWILHPLRPMNRANTCMRRGPKSPRQGLGKNGMEQSIGASLMDMTILLSPGIAVFAFVSSQTGFNHHYRYVMPALPYVFLWMSQLASPSVWKKFGSPLKVAIIAMMAWAAYSSLVVFPHSHAYFNEIAGGPRSGHLHLAHSNIDWGQDILSVRQWVIEHPEIQLKGIACISDELIDMPALGLPAKTPPSYRALLLMAPEDAAGWYCVFAMPLIQQRPDYSYFRLLEPMEIVAENVFVYRITISDLEKIAERIKEI